MELSENWYMSMKRKLLRSYLILMHNCFKKSSFQESNFTKSIYSINHLNKFDNRQHFVQSNIKTGYIMPKGHKDLVCIILCIYTEMENHSEQSKDTACERIKS